MVARSTTRRKEEPSELDISVSRLFVLDNLIYPIPESVIGSL